MRFMYVYHRSLQRPKSGNLGWRAKLGTQYIIGKCMGAAQNTRGLQPCCAHAGTCKMARAYCVAAALQALSASWKCTAVQPVQEVTTVQRTVTLC